MGNNPTIQKLSPRKVDNDRKKMVNIDLIPPKCSYSSKCKNYVEIYSQKSNKIIPAIYIENKNTQKVIIYSHDKNKDIGMILLLLHHISRHLSVSVLSYDYPGYGLNKNYDSVLNEHLFYDAISDVYHYLVKIEKKNPGNIILYGIGIGIYPTLFLARTLCYSKQILIKSIIIQITTIENYEYFIEFLKIIKYPLTIIYTVENDKVLNKLIDKTMNLYKVKKIIVNENKEIEISSPREWMQALTESIH